MLGFLGDAIVALLLCATIGYSVVLNRRLGTVRSDRDKFEALVRNLNTASQRAEVAVTNLRVVADDLTRRLEKKVEEARGLSDDLVYMIDRGGAVADRLASQIRTGRDEMKPNFSPEPAPPPPPRPAAQAAPVPRPDHRVEPVLRQPPRAEAPRAPAPAPRSAPTKPDWARVEPRVAVNASEPAPRPQAPERAQAPERPNAPSRAERELLRALAARR
jgi:hypothetical protein